MSLVPFWKPYSSSLPYSIISKSLESAFPKLCLQFLHQLSWIFSWLFPYYRTFHSFPVKMSKKQNAFSLTSGISLLLGKMTVLLFKKLNFTWSSSLFCDEEGAIVCYTTVHIFLFSTHTLCVFSRFCAPSTLQNNEQKDKTKENFPGFITISLYYVKSKRFRECFYLQDLNTL